MMMIQMSGYSNMKMMLVCELGLAYWMCKAENGPHGKSGRQPPPRALCGLSFADLYAYNYKK